MSQQFDPRKALVKLLIYFKDGSNPKTYYSLQNDDKKGRDYSLSRMNYRLLLKKHKGQFTTAIFYDNISGNELSKYGFFGDKIK